MQKIIPHHKSIYVQSLLLSVFLSIAVVHPIFAAPTPLDKSQSDTDLIVSLPIADLLSQIPELPIPPAQCTTFDRPGTISNVKIERAFDKLKFRKATSMVIMPGENERWAISSQEGLVKRFLNEQSTETAPVILDIRDRVIDASSKSGNWGIQSVAFHPNFIQNGELYLSYNSNDQNTGKLIAVLSRFTSANGESFDSASEEILIRLEQDEALHGIGQLAFGPDGLLYVGFGDGGVSAQAQDMNDFRGKILRIDIDGAFPYQIPPNNPFVGSDSAEEIYALGLRNPWRFSFDSKTGFLYAADVGENHWEEVDLIEAGGNYGWPIMEGAHCLQSGCDTSGLQRPVYEYSHDQGCAIIGGYIYRGEAIPDLQGSYIFADFCAAELRAVNLELDPPKKEALDIGLISNTGFGQSNTGELFTLSLFTGNLHQVLPRTEAGGFLNPVPKKLSETACFSNENLSKAKLRLKAYEVNSALWSDGAEKKRWISLPRLEQINLDDDGGFLFPIGTVLIKEFAFDGIPFETRLLVRHRDGFWGGYSYEWRDDGTDADLLDTGKTKTVGPNVSWDYPSPDQCMICHSAAKNIVLGPEIAQLNRFRKHKRRPGKHHQLKRLNRSFTFAEGLPDKISSLPTLSAIDDDSKSVANRARSYLHANCSHCHLPNGPTPVSIDFRFNTPINNMNLCKVAPVTDDFGLSAPYLIDPGNPANSIISLRMSTTGHKRMPPLGSSIVHRDAVQLINEWITNVSLCEPNED